MVQEEKVTGSEDVVYIDANATGETADGKTYDMYDLTTGEKTTVVCKEDNSPDAGFATYTVDADNTYKFKTFTPLTTGNDNKDGAYDVANGEVSTYNGTLSVDSGSKADIIGLSARNALILNLVSGNSDSLTLSDLASATTLTALAYVKDETVVAIVVTAYTAAV